MITVSYDCPECGTVARGVLVPERESSEDVVSYVRDKIATCVAEDHARLSPHCRARTIANLKIPIVPGKGVGER